MKSISVKKNRKAIIYTLITTFLVIVIGVVLFFTYSGQKLNHPADQSALTDKSDSEIQREQELKSNPEEKVSNQADTPVQPPVNEATGKQKVNVVITTAGIYDEHVEARGFVTDSVENSGTCTYNFTDGVKNVSKTTSPLPNSTSTTCQTSQFSSAELSSGKWSVVLSFNSDVSAGQSSPYEFIVP